MTTAESWRETEYKLSHLLEELQRLHNQETPWLMTPVEEGDLLFLLQHATQAISEDMEPDEDEEE